VPLSQRDYELLALLHDSPRRGRKGEPSYTLGRDDIPAHLRPNVPVLDKAGLVSSTAYDVTVLAAGRVALAERPYEQAAEADGAETGGAGPPARQAVAKPGTAGPGFDVDAISGGKQRQLLSLLLKGKGKAPIDHLLRTMYSGSQSRNPNQALDKVKDRTNKTLAKKGMPYEVKQEGQTYQLAHVELGRK
jgi:hypothetical protein